MSTESPRSTETELVEPAAACDPLRHARLLGQWVGNGRTSTPEGWPQSDDLSELADTLGVPLPENPLDPRAPALGRAWVTAREIGFVEIHRHQAHPGPALHEWPGLTAQDTLDAWLSALLSAVHTTLATVDATEAAELTHIALGALAESDTPRREQTAIETLERRLQEEYSGLTDYLGADFDLPGIVDRYSAQLPSELRAFTAIDDNHTVTELGQWALRKLATRQQDDTEQLDELHNTLLAANVDPDDPDAVRDWLEQHPEELAHLAGDSTQPAGEDDFRVIDLKAAFELPDELPAMSLPPTDELAAAARAGNPVLADTDDETALAAWQQQFYELLSHENYLDTRVDESTRAAEESDLDFAAVGAIAVMRLFLDGAAEQEEIREIVNESATIHLEDSVAAAQWTSWLNVHGDPSQHLVDRLLAMGAATLHDTTVELTDLGRAAVRERLEECDVSLPLLPPAERMSAPELVSAVETVDEPEMLRLISTWAAGRETADAATELLTLARDGDPTQRMIAVTVTQRLDPAPVEQWEAALTVPELRAHAKMALADARGQSLEETGEVELDSPELAWLLADSLTATADRLSADELAQHLGESVLPADDEPELFDTIRHSGHAEAHAVLRLIGQHHPDTKTAKAARRAAFKTASDGN